WHPPRFHSAAVVLPVHRLLRLQRFKAEAHRHGSHSLMPRFRNLGLFLPFLLNSLLPGQSSSGTLRLTITDPTGLPVPAKVWLSGESSRLHRDADATSGKFTFGHLPFGVYRVAVTHEGFSPYSSLV